MYARVILIVFLLLINGILPAFGQTAEEYKLKGDEFFQKRDWSEAIKYYDKAIEINPEYGEAWYYKGWALFNKGDYDEGNKCYAKAVELNPSYDNTQAYSEQESSGENETQESKVPVERYLVNYSFQGEDIRYTIIFDTYEKASLFVGKVMNNEIIDCSGWKATKDLEGQEEVMKIFIDGARLKEISIIKKIFYLDN